MKSVNAALVTSWVLQLVVAGILLQTLFFKFTGAAESVYIFTTIGAEPYTTTVGAVLAMGVMVGAIMSHLTILGIEVQGDGGLLFGLALTVFVGSGIVLLIRRADIPVVGMWLRAHSLA
jgi:hypothetical protein